MHLWITYIEDVTVNALPRCLKIVTKKKNTEDSEAVVVFINNSFTTTNLNYDLTTLLPFFKRDKIVDINGYCYYSSDH